MTKAQCQLTTKDHAILQAMLERYEGARDPYLQLLEQKVRHSAVCFADDIPGNVATLNSQVTYRVNDRLSGPCLIVQADGSDLPNFAVSIRRIPGLALLGLTQGEAVSIQTGAGSGNVFTLVDVVSQPEATARMLANPHNVANLASQGSDRKILSFSRRAARTPYPDDDPGPSAA